MENKMKTQSMPSLKTIRKGWCHSLIQQLSKWNVVVRDSLVNTEDFVWEEKKRKTFSCKFSGTKESGCRCINGAEMKVIKGHDACAHDILAAKLQQMCCLWDIMGMIKDHQRQVMSERLFSSVFNRNLCLGTKETKGKIRDDFQDKVWNKISFQMYEPIF